MPGIDKINTIQNENIIDVSEQEVNKFEQKIDANLDTNNFQDVLKLKNFYNEASDELKTRLNEEFNKVTPELDETLLESSVITENNKIDINNANELNNALLQYPNLSPITKSKLESFAHKKAEFQKGAGAELQNAINNQNGSNKEKINKDIE